MSNRTCDHCSRTMEPVKIAKDVKCDTAVVYADNLWAIDGLATLSKAWACRHTHGEPIPIGDTPEADAEWNAANQEAIKRLDGRPLRKVDWVANGRCNNLVCEDSNGQGGCLNLPLSCTDRVLPKDCEKTYEVPFELGPRFGSPEADKMFEESKATLIAEYGEGLYYAISNAFAKSAKECAEIVDRLAIAADPPRGETAKRTIVDDLADRPDNRMTPKQRESILHYANEILAPKATAANFASEEIDESRDNALALVDLARNGTPLDAGAWDLVERHVRGQPEDDKNLAAYVTDTACPTCGLVGCDQGGWYCACTEAEAGPGDAKPRWFLKQWVGRVLALGMEERGQLPLGKTCADCADVER